MKIAREFSDCFADAVGSVALLFSTTNACAPGYALFSTLIVVQRYNTVSCPDRCVEATTNFPSVFALHVIRCLLLAGNSHQLASGCVYHHASRVSVLPHATATLAHHQAYNPLRHGSEPNYLLNECCTRDAHYDHTVSHRQHTASLINGDHQLCSVLLFVTLSSPSAQTHSCTRGCAMSISGRRQAQAVCETAISSLGPKDGCVVV